MFFKELLFGHTLLMCTNESTKKKPLQMRTVFQEDGQNQFFSTLGQLYGLRRAECSE
jgi:hypothetical protein